jgi:hypothetical protein
MINDGLEAGGRFNFLFDFAKHGGAVATILVGPKLIPPETIITSGMIRVVTACTSGGSATVALHLSSSEDILGATAVASLTLDALLDSVPVGTAATSILCTAATQLSVVVAVAALTAGKIAVSLFGFRSTTT